MNSRPIRVLLSAISIAASTVAAHAQTPLSGALSDSTTGPLLSGVVYHTTSNISVAAGETLTIQPGAIVKFGATAHTFFVGGVLDVNGTPGSKVIFTSIHDDTAGGDTNGNGAATSPAAGQWRSVNFGAASDASSLQHLEVRYAGNASVDAVNLNAADISMSDCVVRNAFAVGLDLTANSRPTVANCSFLNNGGVAVDTVEIDALPGFSNCTASGNGRNYVRVTDGVMAGDVSITTANCIGGILWWASSVAVPAGMQLTLGDGITVKAESTTGTFTVNGTLTVNGTAGSKVVFTGASDDSAGGDSNNDGPSVGAPGSWRSVNFGPNSDASSLTWCEVRYAGNASVDAVNLNSANITLTSCTVRNAQADGLDLSANSRPTVTACAFNNNGNRAVDTLELDALPGFSNCTATGNVRNYANVTDGVMAGDVTISTSNCLNSVVWMSGSWTVPSGLTLTLGPGVVVKHAAGAATGSVLGVLTCNGTAASRVIFTGATDDSAAGDTDGGGASVGVAGSWRAINFGPDSDASVLSNTEVRFAGNASVDAVNLNTADITLIRCTIRDSFATGLGLSANSLPMVRFCSFISNGGLAVDYASIGAVPGFSFNTASGNGGDHLRITNGVVPSDMRIDSHNGVGPALVSAVTILAPAGVTLTLGKGVILKYSSTSMYLRSDGRILCEGTLASPVVLTVVRDDSFGGDTNSDGGATSPTPGSWRGVYIHTTDAGSVFENVLVRYAGNASIPALDVVSSQAKLSHVRVELASATGLSLRSLSEGSHLTAWSCGGDGFELANGAFALSHVTAVANGDNGVDRAPGCTATLVDSIVWNNTATNLEGFSAGSVTYSNGDAASAGTLGNIDIDPLFIDAPNGNLRLGVGSPCVNAGDPASEVDADGTRADMGAYPSDNGGAPSVYCTAKLNSLGCAPTVDFSGYASVSDVDAFRITCTKVISNRQGLFYYGYAATATPFQGGTKCVATPTLRMPIQNSLGNPAPDDCSGSYAVDMNARIQSGIDAMLVVGVNVYGQFWMRDPQSPSTTGLSDAIQFRVAP